MMKFRRSMKSESSKHDSQKPVQISIPQKDAIAIEPPKKVIKALYDYSAPTDPPHYLSFSAGDFLHVVSRENDPDWYEACNPLVGSRGLVPVKYFQEVGKTVRDSADSTKSGSATHDSGYAEGAQAPGRNMMGNGSNFNNTRTSTNNGFADMPPPSAMQRSRTSMAKAGGVYGIVIYDFQAERPDELDAKAGEAIIVIAQSNPEWFVAKPITRLGGPGLIPVSFIEIRDMTTGKAVDDAVAAVAKAGIPRVEDWKRMAAEYKNTSIPLGQVTTRDQAAQSMQQGMQRVSLGSDQQQSQQVQQPSQQTPSQQSQQQQPQNGQGHQRSPSNYQFEQQQEQNLYAPIRASVPKFTFADDKFHFVVECKLSNGSHWDLSRIYEDFYELQINLINAFPDEAGQTGKQRTLPYMPGPVKFVTDNISEGRRANLDEYLRDLLKMSANITSSSLVRNFFHPRDGDYEVDPGAVDLSEHARPSGIQQQRQSTMTQNTSLQPPNGQSSQDMPTDLAQFDGTHMSDGPFGPPQNQQQSNDHTRSASQFTLQSSNHNASGSITQGPSHTSNTSISGPASSAPVKVKAWFDRDTCVVIRMPARGQFTFEELYRKISERRRLEFKGQVGDESDSLDIEYRDEKDGEYYRLEGDEDLDIAVERNEKLTLAVRATRT